MIKPILGLLIVAVVVYVALMIQHASYIQSIIGGFWEAEESFCQESEVDMFCIYFDKDVDVMGNRAAYVIAKKDEQIILNEPTKAKITMNNGAWANWGVGLESPKYLSIKFAEINEECQDVFPLRQTMRLYPSIGKMVLYSGDTITAVLYKNSVNTELRDLMAEKRGELKNGGDSGDYESDGYGEGANGEDDDDNDSEDEDMG